ncbi:hypothetical protein GCM10023321_16830 [Pseudonocardia eucalypti]|uniref:Uncharacterized protein n=1 Tax=Pseudonocardia eucalypti TaxID=648755 RepID=A0ABP9PW60_9PSEU|nr:hypothetical protein [Pseudonocardia eucalypti]
MTPELNLPRAINDNRGWLVAAVALMFILSTGVLGLQLASPERPEAEASPAAGAGPVPAAPATDPAANPGRPAPDPAPPAAPNAAAPAPAAPAAPVPAAPAAPNPAAPDPAAPAAPNSAGTASAVAVERTVARLRERGFTATETSGQEDRDCVANSYGGTREFLRANPCAGLRRSLLEVRTPDGGLAQVAVAWVHMPDAAGAAGLKAVLDRVGTGNMTPLGGAAPFAGRYYASTARDATVVNAEARPLQGRLDGAALRAIVTAAAS